MRKAIAWTTLGLTALNAGVYAFAPDYYRSVRQKDPYRTEAIIDRIVGTVLVLYLIKDSL